MCNAVILPSHWRYTVKKRYWMLLWKKPKTNKQTNKQTKKKQTCNTEIRLTNGGLTKLLIGDLIGNVSSHQHTHGDPKLLLDHIWDEFKSIRPLVDTLEKQTQGQAVYLLKSTPHARDKVQPLPMFHYGAVSSEQICKEEANTQFPNPGLWHLYHICQFKNKCKSRKSHF